MAKKKVYRKAKGKGKTAVVRQKKDSGNGKIAQKALKYPFDTLNRGKSFTIEGADQMEGNVTKRENIRRLAYEFGLRSNREFEVTPIQEGKCIVKRIK